MRWILWTFLAALVAGAIALYVVSRPGQAVETAEVRIGTIQEYVEERGRTRLPQTWQITMPLEGRIQPITLEEGDQVERGQVVARMDAADLQTDLSSAVAQVNQYERLIESMLRTTESSVAQRESREKKFSFLDKEFKRVRSLREQNTVTQAELERAELAMYEALYELREATFTVDAMESILAAVRIGRETAEDERQKKQRDRDRAEIVSPVAGTVLHRNVSNERVLAAGELLLEIGNLDDLEVEAEILTQDAVRIQEGDPVDIIGPAIGPRPVRGSVSRIYPRGFEKVSSLGVEQQRVMVIIQFDEGVLEELKSSGRQLGVEYRVRVRIYTEEKPQAVIVPRSAIFRGADGNWQAFIVRDRTARRVNVDLGLMNEFEAEVLTGLHDGDTVIVAPESGLEHGQRVEPRPAASALSGRELREALDGD